MRREFLTLMGVAGVAAAAVLVWYAVERGYTFETDYTCVRCRAVRHVTTFFGSQPVSVVGAAGAPWFAEHVPEHAHEWGWSGRTVTHRLFGWDKHGCGERHPIWLVKAEEQARFMAVATDEEIESFYAFLKSPDLAARQRILRMVYDRAKKGKR
jgi:hypothetical protein